MSDSVLTLIHKWRDDPNTAPPLDGDRAAQAAWEEDLARARSESTQFAKALEAGREGDETHTEVQGWRPAWVSIPLQGLHRLTARLLGGKSRSGG